MTASDGDLAARACQMYEFFGCLGREVHDLGDGRVVTDPQHPDVWSANKVFGVRAVTIAAIDVLHSQVDALLAHLPYRFVVTDVRTPPAYEAYLAMHDFEVHATTVQMILSGTIRSGERASSQEVTLDVQPVTSEAQWSALLDLVLADHAEGKRTQGATLDRAVSEGMVAGYRSKTPAARYFLGVQDGQPCAYGAGIVGPDGLGMVEDLYTLPSFRGRGIASHLIRHCVAYARTQGCSDILIGSHVNETPKHLYQRLGFQPVCVTREYLKRL